LTQLLNSKDDIIALEMAEQGTKKRKKKLFFKRKKKRPVVEGETTEGSPSRQSRKDSQRKKKIR
jgi:hypothetical protein